MIGRLFLRNLLGLLGFAAVFAGTLLAVSGFLTH
jgi:hypothetical protein